MVDISASITDIMLINREQTKLCYTWSFEHQLKVFLKCKLTTSHDYNHILITNSNIYCAKVNSNRL